MNKKNYFTIIDFGSSKIRFSVFDTNLNEKFSENKNVILSEEYKDHFETIEKIVKIAEKKISYHIKDIILTLDSSELFTIELSLNKNLDNKIPINKIYGSLILELNKIINMYYSNLYLAHIVLDKYSINDKIYVNLPKDEIITNNIKADFKVICFPKILIGKLKKKFIDKNLNLVNIFCTSYIKSQNYLKNINKNKVSFLEIGLGRTSVLFYESNRLKLIQTIPIGSFNITKDISKIFRITNDEAEKIKKSFNKSETEFSYQINSQENPITVKDIIDKNISINLLKEVILYRVQEIIDLIFKRSSISNHNYNLINSELFLIGEGSRLFDDNSFYLNDKFHFKSINFYEESDGYICKSGLIYHLNNHEIPKIINKKQGLFEKFFNYFSR